MDESSAHFQPAFNFCVSDDGIFDIQPQGPLLPELSQAIVRQVRTRIGESGIPAGILLDMRPSADVSIVRLSHLIDLLTEYEAPLAVLFSTEDQVQLAVLLHNTLNNHEQVAYFTSRERAWDFILTGTIPSSSNTRR